MPQHFHTMQLPKFSPSRPNSPALPLIKLKKAVSLSSKFQIMVLKDQIIHKYRKRLLLPKS